VSEALRTARLWNSQRLNLLPADLYSACRVMFEAGDAIWHLVVSSSSVTVGDGPIADPDVTLRWSLEDATAIAQGDLDGNDALLRTTVIASDLDGTYEGPPAPLNLGSRRELEAMPLIPGATVTVGYRYRLGPFGESSYLLSFVDGRVEQESVHESGAPDVRVEVSYRSMAAVRAGEMSILDALVDGSVTGEEGALGLLGGLSESREFHAAELATGRQAFALATLGELRAALLHSGSLDGDQGR
jgi:hypothetical protein